jgi:hypothetical protein
VTLTKKKNCITLTPGLLGAQLDERGLAEEESEHVGHDVVDDHHQDGQDEPDERLEHVLETIRTILDFFRGKLVNGCSNIRTLVVIEHFCDFTLTKSCKTCLGPMLPPGPML